MALINKELRNVKRGKIISKSCVGLWTDGNWFSYEAHGRPSLCMRHIYHVRVGHNVYTVRVTIALFIWKAPKEEQWSIHMTPFRHKLLSFWNRFYSLFLVWEWEWEGEGKGSRDTIFFFLVHYLVWRLVLDMIFFSHSKERQDSLVWGFRLSS